jgi:hypothetical protein
MTLSDELFEQIVTSLAAGEATTLPSVALYDSAERRRNLPRHVPGREARVTLIPLTDALAPGPLDLELRNVSPGGVKFIFPNRIGLDEQFVLMLPSQEGPVAVLCGVAYWQPVAPGEFAIGAKFTRVLRQGSRQTTHQPDAEIPSRKAV